MGLFTAQKIAEIRKLSLDEVLTQVRENVRGMYGIWGRATFSVIYKCFCKQKCRYFNNLQTLLAEE